MKVVIADDEPLARERLRALLADESAWEVVTFEQLADTPEAVIKQFAEPVEVESC